MALLVTILIVPAAADPARTPTPLSTAPALTQGDVTAWLDGLLPYAIRQGNVAGAVVTIVKDGRLLAAKGYGYADVAARRPMDPGRTIVRVGSISKLFVWTAVTQLVAAGKIDLDVDVNRYLDFHIPDYQRKPLTMRDIVTHRSGFEESLRDVMGRYPQQDLEHYVKANLPARIYAPGQVPAYSNFASALAGYIVQRVSGEAFDHYAARHILLPLDMNRSTFRQPIPGPWRADLAVGYRTAAGPVGYYEFIGPAPAGSLATTAVDMARFMVAHLPDRGVGTPRVLPEPAAQAMHAAQSRIFPALNAVATGFYETTRNGHRSIAHNGGTQFFHSDLHLLLDDSVGIFIALNSAGDDDAATRIHNALFEGFMDRYFPADAVSPPTPLATAREHARALAGYWESSRRSDSSWLSIAGLFNAVRITDCGDGSISLPFPARGTVRWQEVGPYVWRAEGAKDHLQAISASGVPVMIGFDAAPPAAFLPVPWWRSPAWLQPALTVALALLLVHAFTPAASAVARRVLGVGYVVPHCSRLHRLVPPFASLALVLLAIAFPIMLEQFGGDLTNMSVRTDVWVYALQAATLLALVAATVMALLAAIAAWRAPHGWWCRTWPILWSAALAVLWWTVVAFRLANFNLHY